MINTRGFLLSLFPVVSRCAQAPQVPDAVLLNTWQGSPNPDATGVVARLLAILAYFLLRNPLDTPSIAKGRALFKEIGCALCHTPALHTGKAATAALSEKPVPLYSDLLVHGMGPGLADQIIQGNAGPDEFRTAPLWGLGQRIFFLHDGRTKDLVEAIRAHASHRDKLLPPSEANKVIARFRRLKESEKQDILNFLRGLWASAQEQDNSGKRQKWREESS